MKSIRLTASGFRRGSSLGVLGLDVLGFGLVNQFLLVLPLSLERRLSLRCRDGSLMVDAVKDT